MSSDSDNGLHSVMYEASSSESLTAMNMPWEEKRAETMLVRDSPGMMKTCLLMLPGFILCFQMCRKVQVILQHSPSHDNAVHDRLYMPPLLSQHCQPYVCVVGAM